MNTKFDVITIGGMVRDISFFTDKGRVFRTPENLTAQKMLAFEYGAKIYISDTYYTMGGGASNTAYVFTKLGMRAAILGRMGNDEEGGLIRKYLESSGISTRFVQKDEKKHTGYSLILCSSKKEHDHIVFTYRGANDGLEADEARLKDLDARWFYISSLCGDLWLKSLKNIVQYAKSHRIKIAWNPGNLQLQAGKKVLEKILQSTDVLIINKDEAIELVLSGITIGKRNPNFLNRSLYLLHMINDWGPKVVVITEGSKGAYALKNSKVFHVKAVRRKVIDTTGVGDTFGATFVTRLIECPEDIETAMKWAAINSAYNLTKVGAQEGALTREELLEKVNRK